MSGRPRKLTLWHTQNFIPLMNHEDDLLPIMEVLGFRPKSLATKIYPITTTTATQWIVYTYVKKWKISKTTVEEEQPPNPKLPYPRIDGLHPSTYEDFLNNVKFYLNMDDISDILHVRGMNMLQSDLGVKWHLIEGDICLQNYFYKDGTESKVLCGDKFNNQNSEDDGDSDKNIYIRSKGKDLPPMKLQPLKDIITVLSHAER